MAPNDPPLEHEHKILIVDDNADLRKVLALHLKESKYETVEAASSLEALDQARATRPDLILMDLAMLADTGDQAIAWLKADPSLRTAKGQSAKALLAQLTEEKQMSVKAEQLGAIITLWNAVWYSNVLFVNMGPLRHHAQSRYQVSVAKSLPPHNPQQFRPTLFYRPLR